MSYQIGDKVVCLTDGGFSFKDIVGCIATVKEVRAGSVGVWFDHAPMESDDENENEDEMLNAFNYEIPWCFYLHEVAPYEGEK